MSFRGFFFFIFIFALFLFIAVFYSYKYALQQHFGTQNKELVFPLPEFLAMARNRQVATLDLWHPLDELVKGVTIKKPQIEGRSAISYDTATNKLLFARNEKDKLPMASLTKVMTAIIALENPKSDDKYLVTKSALVGEDSMGLTEGETLSLEELLYGLFLHSGNDAAETLTTNYTGGRNAFIKAMNDKAIALGLKDTHFTNPTGLEGDGDQYTTAYDLLVITQYGLIHFPLFDKVAATFDYHIDQTNTHKEFYLENETNLLTSYSGVKGVKTGFTPEAGLCLITYLEYKDHKIIAVILNSNNRRQDMKDLLDYSLKVQGATPPKHS